MVVVDAALTVVTRRCRVGVGKWSSRWSRRRRGREGADRRPTGPFHHTRVVGAGKLAGVRVRVRVETPTGLRVTESKR
jgi:hypothetical protein